MQVSGRLYGPIAALVGLGLFAVASSAAAQDPSIVANLSLDQLNRLRVKVASVADKPVREQPGIVTVITEREIAATGATDLMDILALVPGFSFATDVGNTVGTAFRGLWAYEGKILLLVDGVAVNEGLFGNILPQHHYAADQIKQIEIIRGPGSAVYGGSAELAVISITTKGSEQGGGAVSVRPEVSSGAFGLAVSGHAGAATPDWRWSLAMNAEKYAAFDRPWISLGGDVVDLSVTGDASPAAVNGAFGWKRLDVRAIYDRDRQESPFGVGLPGATSPIRFSWQTLTGLVKYEAHPFRPLTVTPTVTAVTAHPWEAALVSQSQPFYRFRYERLGADVPAVAAIGRHHLRFGVAGYREGATALNLDPSFGYASAVVYFNGSNHVSYTDGAAYAQLDLEGGWANVSLGGRYEHHSYAGGAFVPRVAVTKVWQAFHLKALYDRAFRTPNIGDIQQAMSGRSVSNELTSAYQSELGYRVDDRVSIVGTLYYMRVDRPIAYTTFDTTHHGYLNGGPVATHGAEIEARYGTPAFSGSIGYSYYTADQQLPESIGLYGSAVEGVNLGLAPHKVAFSATAHLTRRVDWNVSGTAVGSRQAFVYGAGETALPPYLLANTRVAYSFGRSSVAFAVRNLFDQDVVLGQAYNGGVAPLPLLGRNASATMTFGF